MCVELLVGERQNGESDKATQACNDYLRMGPGRSLRKLRDLYNESWRSVAPTTAIGTINDWSAKFNWVERSGLYDADWDRRKTVEREAAFNEGLALDYERIDRLKRLADFLESQLYEVGENGVHHNVWLPDVKQIGGGDDAERVDIERFNSALLSEYRSVLDDLAKETGGRIRKSELSGGVNVSGMDGLLKAIQQAKDDSGLTD